MSPSRRFKKKLKKKRSRDESSVTYYELGIARTVKNIGKRTEVVNVFVVRLQKGNDGLRRVVPVVRARAIEQPVKISEGDEWDNVYGVKIRYRVPHAKLTELVDVRDLKEMTVAELIAGLLENGLMQVDIEGPSAYKFDGNPLTGYANAIVTGIERAFRLNISEGKINIRGIANGTENGDTENEEENEEPESEEPEEEEVEKPKKIKWD